VTSLRRLRGEQSNTSIVCDDRLVLKVFRRLDAGESPELEVGRFLTLRARFPHVPQLAGFAGYAGPTGSPTVAVLTTFVPNDGDGWGWALARLRDYYAAARTRPAGEATAAGAGTLVADDLAAARRLGEVTGELHVALASDPDDPAFAPEPVSPGDLEAWGAAVEARVAGALGELRCSGIAAAEPGIERVLATAGTAAARIRGAIGRLAGVPLWKTRGHGDYHLGQVLRVAGPGDRFAILDFEGEPARPLAERRARHSPLRDVAGMLRSFTYASWAGLFEAAGGPSAARRDIERGVPWESWRAAWDAASGSAFLQGYLAATVERGVKLVPASPEVLALLLSVFSLEKAAYEVSYEINNRPAWLPIPLAAFERELAA
jgi:trehalose synthase-fused probable maltokinase